MYGLYLLNLHFTNFFVLIVFRNHLNIQSLWFGILLNEAFVLCFRCRCCTYKARNVTDLKKKQFFLLLSFISVSDVIFELTIWNNWMEKFLFWSFYSSRIRLLIGIPKTMFNLKLIWWNFFSFPSSSTLFKFLLIQSIIFMAWKYTLCFIVFSGPISLIDYSFTTFNVISRDTGYIPYIP